jgi:hypothetical protein
MEDRTGPIRVAELVRYPSDGTFDTSQLEGGVDEGRLEALLDEAEPTEIELQAWRDTAMESHRCDAPGVHMVTLYILTQAPGHVLVWANLHEDRGSIWERIGPYMS